MAADTTRLGLSFWRCFQPQNMARVGESSAAPLHLLGLDPAHCGCQLWQNSSQHVILLTSPHPIHSKRCDLHSCGEFPVRSCTTSCTETVVICSVCGSALCRKTISPKMSVHWYPSKGLEARIFNSCIRTHAGLLILPACSLRYRVQLSMSTSGEIYQGLRLADRQAYRIRFRKI